MTDAIYPVKIAITEAVLLKFKQSGIATTFSIEEFNSLGGWLSACKTYSFKSDIVIEGPSGFYGGSFGPNKWTADGGLCTMGAASYSHSALPEGLSIGRYCSIGKGLRFLDFAHPTTWLSSSVAFFTPIGADSFSALAALCDRQTDKPNARVKFDPKLGLAYPKIHNDVWIGENVALAMGIQIGTGAVIASGAIVTKDVPPYALVAGVPAEVKKYRFSEMLIAELIASKWWEFSFSDFGGMDFTDVRKFLDCFNPAFQSGRISKWVPKTLRLPYDLGPPEYLGSVKF